MTPIMTMDGWTTAEGLRVGDKIASVSSEHIDAVKLKAENLSEALPTYPVKVSLVETEVVSITVKTGVLVGFNELAKNYSTTQPVFIETDSGLTYVNAGDVKIGDTLIGISEDGVVLRTPVKSIEKDDVESEVYDIRTSPQPWFISDPFVVIA